MNFPESHVKIEATEGHDDPRTTEVGPFKIQRVDNPQKPFYQPLPAGWSNFENAKYAAFVLYNQKKMQNLSNSKLWSIYKEMSQFIQTRNFRQCKAHHNQHINLLTTIPRIVDYLLASIPNFDSLLSIETQCLQNLYASNKLPISVNSDQSGSLGSCELPRIFFPKEVAHGKSDEYFPQTKPCFNDGHEQFLQYKLSTPIPIFRLQKTKQEEWMQCHHLFQQWTVKMKQLMVLRLQL